MEGTFKLGNVRFILGLRTERPTDNDQAVGPYKDHRSGLVFSYTSTGKNEAITR